MRASAELNSMLTMGRPECDRVEGTVPESIVSSSRPSSASQVVDEGVGPSGGFRLEAQRVQLRSRSVLIPWSAGGLCRAILDTASHKHPLLPALSLKTRGRGV